MEPSVTETTFEMAVLDISYCHKIESGLMKIVTATNLQCKLPTSELQEIEIFVSFVGRFLFIQVLEFWILGTVMVFLLRQVSV
jgi:hypothetical protein